MKKCKLFPLTAILCIPEQVESVEANEHIFHFKLNFLNTSLVFNRREKFNNWEFLMKYKRHVSENCVKK